MRNIDSSKWRAISLFCFLTVLFSFSALAQVGIGTTDPREGSILDVDSPDKGIYIPKFNISDPTSLGPITGITNLANAEGLLIYNSNTTVGPGFFFWNGSGWNNVANTSNNVWKIGGNTGTTPGTLVGQNYLGTTDPKDLVIGTQGSERIRIKSNGQIGVGTNDPQTKLDINGGLSLREGPALTSITNGANANINLGATPYSQYRITNPTAAFSIRSIIPTTGADGQIVTLINTTAFPMIIEHNMGNANRRIYCPGETNLILTERYSTVTLEYNANVAKWTVQSYSKREADLSNVTDITRYIVTGPDIAPNTVYSLTVTIAGIQTGSTGIISITGNWGADIYDDITIHNIEMRTNQVRFAVSNNTVGTTYPAMQFNLTIIR